MVWNVDVDVGDNLSLLIQAVTEDFVWAGGALFANTFLRLLRSHGVSCAGAEVGRCSACEPDLFKASVIGDCTCRCFEGAD